MKQSELRQLIREEISKIINESLEIDLSKPFSVVEKGGPIGSNNKDYFPQLGGTIIKTFDNAEEAKEYAKRRRNQLTPGEKSYYRMTYTVVKTPKKR